MGGYDGSRGDRGSYGAPAPSPRQAMTSPPAVGSAQPASPTRRVQLSIAKFEDKTLANQYVFGNL
jgi:vesicle-fusing ATPase